MLIDAGSLGTGIQEGLPGRKPETGANPAPVRIDPSGEMMLFWGVRSRRMSAKPE
jgi:hypothetical protein